VASRGEDPRRKKRWGPALSVWRRKERKERREEKKSSSRHCGEVFNIGKAIGKKEGRRTGVRGGKEGEIFVLPKRRPPLRLKIVVTKRGLCHASLNGRGGGAYSICLGKLAITSGVGGVNRRKGRIAQSLQKKKKKL